MKISDEDIEKIKYMYRVENKLIKEIAKSFQVDRSRISKIVKDTKKLFEDKEWLYEKYYIENLPKTKMAELANCSESSIRKYTRLYGFETNEYSYRKRKYSYNSDFFKEINTQEKAYWLGFIMADGGIEYSKSKDNKTKTSQIRLRIMLSVKDIEHLKKFANTISDNINIKTRSTYLKKTNKEYKMCILTVYNKEIVDDLVKLGVVTRKSMNETMPNIPKEMYKHFVRGYFDGDGYFSFWESNSRLNCSFGIVGGKEILLAIQKIIKNELNIEPSVYVKNKRLNDKFYTLVTSNKKAIDIMIWLYSNSNIYLERKYNNFQKYLSL